MTQVIRREKRVRGPFGRFVKWVFILFNAFMIFGLFKGWSDANEVYRAANNGAAQAGASIGIALGTGMILSIWALGDFILGLFVLFTRGDKVIIEESP